MSDEKLGDGEWLSALADGQLQGEEFALALDRLGSSDEALTLWHAYHVAGDVLRCADLAECCSRDRMFVAKLRNRLALTPGVEQRPISVEMEALPSRATGASIREVEQQSANDAVVRWKWFAGISAVLAVSVVGWAVVQSPGTEQLATASTGADAMATAAQSNSTERPVMLRDPRLDELLAAHRRFGGTSALQMPAGFLRNATFEQTGR